MQITALENRLTHLERLISATDRLEAIRESIGEVGRRERYYAVVDAACEIIPKLFPVTRKEVLSKRKPAKIAEVRQAAMAVLYEHLGQTSTDIGEFFGGRDHGTVLHALKAIKAREETDPSFAKRMTKLRAMFTDPTE